MERRRPDRPQSPGARQSAGRHRLTQRRDRQRSRVYAWERREVVPHDPTTIAFDGAQAMVNAIWSDMGLRYPPAVERLARQSRVTIATGNRLVLSLPERTPSWCLLHEIAHAMTSTAEGESDGHGAVFVGVYVELLVRYLRLDRGKLMASLEAAAIAVSATARPVFAGD